MDIVSALFDKKGISALFDKKGISASFGKKGISASFDKKGIFVVFGDCLQKKKSQGLRIQCILNP